MGFNRRPRFSCGNGLDSKPGSQFPEILSLVNLWLIIDKMNPVTGNFAWPSWIKLLRAWRLRRSGLVRGEKADDCLRPRKP